MFRKGIQSFLASQRAAVSRQSKRCSSYEVSETEHLKVAHMDMMPIPKGSWQEGYNKKIGYVHKQLVVGAAVLLSGVFGMYAVGSNWTTGRPGNIWRMGQVTKNPPLPALIADKPDEFADQGDDE